MTSMPRPKGRPPAPRFGAIDLGTNNCRLLVASPRQDGFRVVDAFSRIVRLGEGVTATGRLSEAAMARTLEALSVCADKMRARNVTASRAIATQACRLASNGPDFLARVERETGLRFDLITPEEEAKLAARGCTDLIDDGAEGVLVFDIGGGSTEMSWIKLGPGAPETMAWTSLPFGVVTMAEKHGARDMDRAAYDAMVAEVAARVEAFAEAGPMAPLFDGKKAHLIGTSGTVTSLAGVKMHLPRYTRREVDGAWLTASDVARVSEQLREMGFDRRCAEPCIGPERADLVVPGCAILEGILRVWPADRIRVGDRGLREGMLIELMEDHHARTRRG
ncbi:Ppx/GppA phosphatase family protein [Parvularcula dongshanensis]|uniref:Exopolyphosphatase/guanosine-5'-triphosphate, 3'-diphosphate pyrophosphatase n=1 Tax=Parvularcula dongshanensis TaxID=1173995 RepID=A0A840HXN8_9PROT|nr:Ppx/GppA phosphatase family protein [Parvularcula dongshanensis]MBB4657596.1 exopolyphosphatase/guanosine-5'-triphosphate,3'-diphosphate pyrophosphatase [Parvularcula dongshanensis]